MLCFLSEQFIMNEGHLPRDQYVTLSFRLSRWAYGSYAAISAMIGAVLCPCLGYWSVCVSLFLCGVGRYEARRIPPVLRCRGDQCQRYTPSGAWVPIEVTAHWLGPWMIHMSIDGQSFWVWPDSSSQASLWRLRRVLTTTMAKNVKSTQSQIKWPRLARLRRR